MKLVIVESPAKAKTIEKYLGKEYTVRASVGHVRDLPKSNKNAVDIDNGFKPHYEVSLDKSKVISDLKTLTAKADEVILATDPDREGEAIAWHVAEVLGLKNPKRIAFNEITKEAVQAAIASPRRIDSHLREAQEARRVLDRLVGYDLSGLIWKKVRYGLSAGRVQSPALRIVMEKEREIRAFIPVDFWVITADVSADKLTFPLVCSEEPGTLERTEEILKLGKAAGKKSGWNVVDIKSRQTKRNPNPPFITSTLQRTASSRLGMSPSRAMRAAQKLYEAGHITYMRTDSTSLSQQAQSEIFAYIESNHGKNYLSPRSYSKKSKNAQEAHEAIRPSKFATQSAGSTADEKALYDLIWRRTIASQMSAAEIESLTLVVGVNEEKVPDFTTKGSRTLFAGWYAIDPRARGEDVELPNATKGDNLQLNSLESEAKQTQPPNRYSEAGLIKELEKRGIGRPSTYASIIRTIQDRGYVEKEGSALVPTDTGDVVSSFLEKEFEHYISDDFTAEMEDKLDNIAVGDATYEAVLSEFYSPFTKSVESKEDIPKLTNLGDVSKEFPCPECGKPMVYKLGRGGKFMSCGTFPDCAGARTNEGAEITGPEPLGVDPKSGMEVFVLDGRFGPYVQLGEKDDKNKKPRRASLPADKKIEDIDLKIALHLLILPRDLGPHPVSQDSVISNVGRFGPYVGHGRDFRSIKKTSGLDPYTITLEQALELLAQEKQPPRGATVVRKLGEHPKSGKIITLFESKSGFFIMKGLKRIYFDDKQAKKLTLEDAVNVLTPPKAPARPKKKAAKKKK